MSTRKRDVVGGVCMSVALVSAFLFDHGQSSVAWVCYGFAVGLLLGFVIWGPRDA